MDKSESGNEKSKKSTKSKFGAFRRGLKLERAPFPKVKSDDKDEKDRILKPNKTYSLIKKLKLGKSVSNPTLSSPPVYLATEVKRGTLENTPSISSVSTDAASSSGHTRSLHAEMSGSATNTLSHQTDADASSSTVSADGVVAVTQPPIHDDEDDSYESFHESDNNQHEIHLSVDKNAVTSSSKVSNVPLEDSDKLAGKMPAFSDLIYDKQQENAQTVIIHIYIN